MRESAFFLLRHEMVSMRSKHIFGEHIYFPISLRGLVVSFSIGMGLFGSAGQRRSEKVLLEAISRLSGEVQTIQASLAHSGRQAGAAADGYTNGVGAGTCAASHLATNGDHDRKSTEGLQAARAACRSVR